MYQVISYSLQQATQGFPRYICCSLAAECVFCATHIYPNETLFQQCAKTVERLVFSTDPNVLYLGLSCVGDMLIAAPTYVLKFQIQILRCLQSEDPSLRYYVCPRVCRRLLDLDRPRAHVQQPERRRHRLQVPRRPPWHLRSLPETDPRRPNLLCR